MSIFQMPNPEYWCSPCSWSLLTTLYPFSKDYFSRILIFLLVDEYTSSEEIMTWWCRKHSSAMISSDFYLQDGCQPCVFICSLLLKKKKLFFVKKEGSHCGAQMFSHQYANWCTLCQVRFLCDLILTVGFYPDLLWTSFCEQFVALTLFLFLLYQSLVLIAFIVLNVHQMHSHVGDVLK